MVAMRAVESPTIFPQISMKFLLTLMITTLVFYLLFYLRLHLFHLIGEVRLSDSPGADSDGGTGGTCHGQISKFKFLENNGLF